MRDAFELRRRTRLLATGELLRLTHGAGAVCGVPESPFTMFGSGPPCLGECRNVRDPVCRIRDAARVGAEAKVTVLS